MDKNKTTKVMNVISEEIHTYYNSADLRHNLVSEMIPGKKGDQKAYSPIFDMIAYQD